MKYLESLINKCKTKEDFDKLGELFYNLEKRGYVMSDYQIKAYRRITYLDKLAKKDLK